MSEPTRPWWASEPVDGDVDRSVDPVEAHRAARRGWLDPNAPDGPYNATTADHRQWGAPDGDRDAPDPSRHVGGPAPGGDPDGDDPNGGDPNGGDPNGDDPAGADRGPADHAEQICGVCPVCVLARTVGESRPELLGHLTEAARHLSAAARSFLEPPAAPRWPAGNSVDGAAAGAPGEDDTAAGRPGDDTAAGTPGDGPAAAGTSGARRRATGSGRPQRIDLDP